jgi:putative PIN family toxin of toxin-antitoxin system
MSDVPRAIVDTNVFIASIGRTSPYRWLFDALLEGDFRLCLSTPILLEYEEVLADKTTPAVSRNVSGLLLALPNVARVRPHYRWRLIKADPDDNKFVDAALAAGAACIVTHDAHFDALREKDFPSVRVLSAEGFRVFLNEQMDAAW